MKLIDILLENDAPRYNSADDSYGKSRIKSTKKHTLTLRHLNQLKKMRIVKGFEHQDRIELLGTMYGLPDESQQSM